MKRKLRFSDLKDKPPYQKLVEENANLNEENKRLKAILKLSQIAENEWRERYMKLKNAQSEPISEKKKRKWVSFLFDWA